MPLTKNGLDGDIVPENIGAIQAIYAAYELEQARLFAVVDRIAQLFGQGLLPLGRGRAAEALGKLALSGDRLSETERATLYARALGVPGGDGAAEPNREFLSLWLRFLASVALSRRGQVAPAARDLASNASLHGHGLVAYAATRLAAEVRQAFDILGDAELRQAFDARDAWQVIDQISARDLGGARNVARHRTLSTAGSRILGWLADHADPASPDADLVDAVEQWLAASGMSDDAIESYAAPTVSPTAPSTRIDLPALVRDLLESLGVGSSSAKAEPPADNRIAWFRGARRTGRTLAAHALAAALSRELYRVDLAEVVSKYIGETGKNLSRIFDEAERAGAVLLIDDADELFGKRTDVKDAHDRYANLDVAWLIARIEAYPGLVIVVSNADDGGDESCWKKPPRPIPFPRRPVVPRRA